MLKLKMITLITYKAKDNNLKCITDLQFAVEII
jgi:hypothetical protein